MARELTPRQAADLLGISASALRNLTDAGALSHRRTNGGHRRFSEADVLALRAHRSFDQPAQAALRAGVWTTAALELLRAAEADLGPGSVLSARFRAAAAALAPPARAPR